MKRMIRLAVSLMLLLLPAALAARTEPEPLSEAETALQSYLAGSEEATIAAFDHMNRTWTVLKWDGTQLTRLEGPDEKPQIPLWGKGRLKTFVINTNPLVFTADRTATAEATIDSLETLQTLASGLGGIAADTLKVAAVNAPRGGAPLAAGASPTLEDLVFTYVGELGKLQYVTKPLNDLTAAATTLESTTAPLQEEVLLMWLQSVESGVDAKDRPAPAKVELPALAAAFRSLADARKELADDKNKVPCGDSVAAMAEVAAIKRAPLTGPGAPERERAYNTLAVKMTEPTQGCHDDLARATRALSDWFIANQPTPDGPDTEDRKPLDDLIDRLNSVLKVVGQRSEALAKAGALAKTQPAAILAASRQRLFFDRLAKAKVDPARGVLEVSRSSFSGSDIEWTKKRTDTVEVKVDASLKDKLTLRHPETASGSFVADRKLAEGLDVDFALIRTDLFSPSYEAKDLDGEEGDESKVVETDRTSRSGKVAVMAAYRWPLGLGFAFGPQLGAGVDTGDSSLFYGLSLRWRFLSVGWGNTRQKVTALRGQSVGDTLAEGVALQTKDTFETKKYWSLAITITDLPFFKPAE